MMEDSDDHSEDDVVEALVRSSEADDRNHTGQVVEPMGHCISAVDRDDVEASDRKTMAAVDACLADNLIEDRSNAAVHEDYRMEDIVVVVV